MKIYIEQFQRVLEVRQVHFRKLPLLNYNIVLAGGRVIESLPRGPYSTSASASCAFFQPICRENWGSNKQIQNTWLQVRHFHTVIVMLNSGSAYIGNTSEHIGWSRATNAASHGYWLWWWKKEKYPELAGTPWFHFPPSLMGEGVYPHSLKSRHITWFIQKRNYNLSY